MPDCGSQVYLCDVPIRFDTYRGCSHRCEYCFATSKNKDMFKNIKPNEGLIALKNFVEGKRNQNTQWCDWNIPLHIGGMSDPLQPVEKKYGITYECLKYLAKTQYPFIISTKGILLKDEKYIEILSKCNCVVQISAVCSSYDKIEQGCPTYEERLSIAKKISPHVKRVIFRVQPYITEVKDEVLGNIPKIKDAGVYGIILEGMKFNKKKEGLIKIGGDYVYPLQVIKHDLLEIKQEAHKYGLKFYSGENRTRNLGDSLCCCGCGNMEGFKPNEFNLNHILNGERPKPTEKMKQIGTAYPFKGLEQTTSGGHRLAKESFAGEMINYYKNKKDTVLKVLGKKE